MKSTNYCLTTVLVAFTAIVIIPSAEDAHAITVAPSFTAIGQSTQYQAWGVSANGKYVVGWRSGDGTREAFRWDEINGVIGLGDLTGGRFWSEATSVANDGTVVGSGEVNFVGGTNPFRWRPGSGIASIGTLGGSEVQGFANDISADGTVIVGMSKDGSNRQVAYRWTEQGGMVPLGFFGISTVSAAEGISHNGKVIVGGGGSGTEGWYWTVAGGFHGAGRANQFSLSTPRATSSDGSVIVGEASFPGAPNRLAFVSDGHGTFTSLGDIPNGTSASVAYDISGNGRFIVGRSDTAIAVIWEFQNNGYQIYDLKEFLHGRYGLDLGTWQLEQASSISEDGSTIVGYGVSPSGQHLAWRIVIPVPEPKNLSCVFLPIIGLSIIWRRRLA